MWYNWVFNKLWMISVVHQSVLVYQVRRCMTYDTHTTIHQLNCMNIHINWNMFSVCQTRILHKPILRIWLISKSIELCNYTLYTHQLNHVFCAALLVYQRWCGLWHPHKNSRHESYTKPILSLKAQLNSTSIELYIFTHYAHKLIYINWIMSSVHQQLWFIS